MKVAITGGIGEGKSTVLRMIGDLGETTASADDMARAVFHRPDINSRLALAAGVSPPIGAADLRTAMAASPGLRRQVNRITHPPILDAIVGSGARFIEVPLLIETCLQPYFDQVWVVTCGPNAQRRRLLRRYGRDVDIDALLATQLPTRMKIAFADRVIRTNRSLAHVTGIVSEVVSALRG